MLTSGRGQLFGLHHGLDDLRVGRLDPALLAVAEFDVQPVGSLLEDFELDASVDGFIELRREALRVALADDHLIAHEHATGVSGIDPDVPQGGGTEHERDRRCAPGKIVPARIVTHGTDDQWNEYYGRCPKNGIWIRFEDLVCNQKAFNSGGNGVEIFAMKRMDAIMYYRNYCAAPKKSWNVRDDLLSRFDYPSLSASFETLNNVYKRIYGKNITYLEHKKYARYLACGAKLKTIEDIWSQYAQPKEIVNVFMCARDNEATIQESFKHFAILETMYDLRWRYYIYENDSNDETSLMIQQFMDDKQGSWVSETQNAEKFGHSRKFRRVKAMADYRNRCKALCQDWDNSEFSVLMDTDIHFNPLLFKYLKSFMTNGVVMTAPYAHSAKNNSYYDTYALETIDKRSDYPHHVNEPFEVRSAFGGFVLIRTSVLRRCDWKAIDRYHSEHNAFCESVRKYGKIMLSHPTVERTTWVD